MKKIISLFILILTLLAYNKDDDVDSPVVVHQIRFAANEVLPNDAMKDWECKPYEPDYAQVTIDGIDYFPLLYRIDGVLYTQYIGINVHKDSVASSTYTVSKFLLWDNCNTAGDVLEADDIIVMGTPEASSAYAVYVSNPLNYNIRIHAFELTQVPIEVLCFENDSIK